MRSADSPQVFGRRAAWCVSSMGETDLHTVGECFVGGLDGSNILTVAAWCKGTLGGKDLSMGACCQDCLGGNDPSHVCVGRPGKFHFSYLGCRHHDRCSSLRRVGYELQSRVGRLKGRLFTVIPLQRFMFLQ